MNILMIGSGGREHALCWAIRKSSHCDRLYCAPGNGGIADIADCIDLSADDADAVIAFCREKDIGLVVVGPEAPLVAGLVDRLTEAGIKAFGPSAKAAQLEGSKGFTKDICAKYNIPTAAYGRFRDAGAAKAFIRKMGAPIVVKADGLAAGKGVIIAESVTDAEQAVDDMLAGQFGNAGAELVIEEFLEGEEASFFALVDGKTAVPMATAQDHKRAFDGDQGPNTGGMGAYSPAPVLTPTLCEQVMADIILPTVKAMEAEGCPYKGVLYAGLMLTRDGPSLIEYNCRFGDPECQVLMARLKSDMVEAILASVDETLDSLTLNWRDEAALTVVMAAKGYPGSYEKGAVIEGLDAAEAEPGVRIFHAGTKRDSKKTLAAGGRVLNVTALGSSVTDAKAKAYAAIQKINWAEGFYRSDIGYRAVKREQD